MPIKINIYNPLYCQCGFYQNWIIFMPKDSKLDFRAYSAWICLLFNFFDRVRQFFGFYSIHIRLIPGWHSTSCKDFNVSFRLGFEAHTRDMHQRHSVYLSAIYHIIFKWFQLLPTPDAIFESFRSLFHLSLYCRT